MANQDYLGIDMSVDIAAGGGEMWFRYYKRIHHKSRI